jgi:hypothetical protein
MNETTSPRELLIKRLRAESEAANEHLAGVPGVVATGILHLAALCQAAANELEMWTIPAAPPEVRRMDLDKLWQNHRIAAAPGFLNRDCFDALMRELDIEHQPAPQEQR